MSFPRVVAVAPGSPAARAGVLVGDEVAAVDGEAPRDIIRWKWLTDEPDPVLDLRRGGLDVEVQVTKASGEPIGVEVHSALFDQLRTCDNHCEFCFIYQLPPGLRKSLYLKDDDYRLSFLYGNFTTLTRFTEADLERVVTEGLSPLNVSIHATDPAVRSELLRNRRGATSLRWLRALLDHGVEVHGQLVICPGINDGAVLDDTFAGVLDQYPELASLCAVPLGVSQFNPEPRMRPHTRAEAAAVVDAVHDWQDVYLATLGHRLVFAADEYYLLAGRDFPAAEAYEGFPMHEDGIGMARTFELEFTGRAASGTGAQAGFFAWADAGSAGDHAAGATAARPGGSAVEPVAAGSSGDHQATLVAAVGVGVTAGGRGSGVQGADAGQPRPGVAPECDPVSVGAPSSGPVRSASSPVPVDGTPVRLGTRYEAAGDYDAPAEGYRAVRATAPIPASTGCGSGAGATAGGGTPVALLTRRPDKDAPVGILTGTYGARILGPLVADLGRDDVRVIPVENRFFGGNTGVAGLLVAEDLARVLAEQPEGHRYLLPDSCLSSGRFLDGGTVDDLPRPVEVVATDGIALRQALEPRS
jgi:putative radical SAM enzyme (TIGR03279 family)